jgi:hypothetical protein
VALKVYASESVNANGSAPPPEPDEFDPDEEIQEEHDFSNLFDAPDYSSFIKTKPNSKAKSYEARVASLMKAGLIGSLNAGNYPDAATFLKHGPGFAKATGNLAADDPKIAGIVEMLTAPESPYVMFALVAIPLVSQLLRNHRTEIGEAGATFREKRAQRKQEKKAGVRQPSTIKPLKFKLFKREITIPIRVRIKLPNFKNAFKAFLAPTQHPVQITNEVLGDPRVQSELRKMGIYPAGDRDAA